MLLNVIAILLLQFSIKVVKCDYDVTPIYQDLDLVIKNFLSASIQATNYTGSESKCYDLQTYCGYKCWEAWRLTGHGNILSYTQPQYVYPTAELLDGSNFDCPATSSSGCKRQAIITQTTFDVNSKSISASASGEGGSIIKIKVTGTFSDTNTVTNTKSISYTYDSTQMPGTSCRVYISCIYVQSLLNVNSYTHWSCNGDGGCNNSEYSGSVESYTSIGAADGSQVCSSMCIVSNSTGNAYQPLHLNGFSAPLKGTSK